MGAPNLSRIRAAMEKARAVVGQQCTVPPSGNGKAMMRVQTEPWIFCGFPRTPVAAGAAGIVITANVTKAFHPKVLRIPARIAAAFEITNIEVGTDCYRASVGPTPAEMFSEPNGDIVLALRPTEAVDTINLTVNEVAGTGATFVGTIFGPPCPRPTKPC